MDLTVVICTWNRAELLRQTLQNLSQIKKPEGCLWEVLVVNNNCTDHTASIINEFTDALPIRTVIETEQGLSAARNRGIDESSAELILWTDDDVLVGDDWLVEYAKAIREHPDAAFFGGPICPWFDGKSPAWLARGWREVGAAYALRDLGPAPIPLTEGALPFGANYAVRRSEQTEYRYDPSLGRKGGTLSSGEETSVMRQMIDAGHKGLWLPKAEVKHFIGKDRQTISYLRSYYYWSARSRYDVSGSQGAGTNRSVFGVPFYLFRSAVTCELRYRFRRVTGNPAWLGDLCVSSSAWGKVAKHWLSYRGRSGSDY